MNIALILAGGTGRRMHQEVPKQFRSEEHTSELQSQR